jgi:hypothetical protein
MADERLQPLMNGRRVGRRATRLTCLREQGIVDHHGLFLHTSDFTIPIWLIGPAQAASLRRIRGPT